MLRDVFIVSATRTPIGKYNGALAHLPAPRLGAHLVRHLLLRYPQVQDQIDEVILGCAIPAGLGQNPARQAAVFGGIAEKTPACTISSACGSGLDSVIAGSQMIQSGEAEIVLCGGMESMSQCPRIIGRGAEERETMLHDGLLCALTGEHMADTAERPCDGAGVLAAGTRCVRPAEPRASDRGARCGILCRRNRAT